MNFFKKLFFDDEPEGVTKVEGDSLSLTVRVEGQLPYTSSAVFITAFAKKRGESTGVAVSVKFAWYRIVNGSETLLQNTSNAYFFSAGDLFTQVKVVVTSLETPDQEPSEARFGPILLDPRIKADLYTIASHSEGLMFNLRTLICPQGRLQRMENPCMYIFDSYFKVVCQRNGRVHTLRVNLVDHFKIFAQSNLISGLRLEIRGDPKIADFLECMNTDTLDMEFESSFDRDKAIIAIRLFSCLHNIRNEVILSKILPLLSPDNEIESIKIADINAALQKEIHTIQKIRQEEQARTQSLENEIEHLKSQLNSNQFLGHRFPMNSTPRAEQEANKSDNLAKSLVMGRESIADEKQYRLPQDIDMSFSNVIDK